MSRMEGGKDGEERKGRSRTQGVRKGREGVKESEIRRG